MKSLIAFWSIFKKDIKYYYLMPSNINWGITFPLSWTLMQFIRSPESSMLELLPGLIAMCVLFGTTSLLAVTITFERSEQSFERLLLAPLSFSEARSMISSLKSYQIIKGVRGQKGLNEALFAEIIVRLSILLRYATEIKEMDINPLLADGKNIVAVDARIRIEK